MRVLRAYGSPVFASGPSLVGLRPMRQLHRLFRPSEDSFFTKSFQERAFELVTKEKRSEEETKTLKAFVSHHKPIQEAFRAILEAEKPLDELSEEELDIVKIVVNFDSGFAQMVEVDSRISRNSYPIRLYVNFDQEFKDYIEKVFRHFPHENLSTYWNKGYLYANHNREFLKKVTPLIGKMPLDQLNEDQRKWIEIYVNNNQDFIDNATSLMHDFRTMPALSVSE